MVTTSIAESLGLVRHELARKKAAQRRAVLRYCSPVTQLIHRPIINVEDLSVLGAQNPGGLGQAVKFSSFGALGRTGALFDSTHLYAAASKSGIAEAYGGDVYANPYTPEVAAVCVKFAHSHDGVGAILCINGLNAGTTALRAFKPTAVLLPDGVFFPFKRFLIEEMGITPIFYPATASHTAADVAPILDAAIAEHGKGRVLLWMEIPANITYEIGDIDGIAGLARERGVRALMNNTWATHALFKPIHHRIPIVLQATSKIEGGFGDTPSGVVIADNHEDLAELTKTWKNTGLGTVNTQLCARLFHRMDSTAERLAHHFATAEKMTDWFALQTDIVKTILCPTREGSPDYPRAQEYFGGKGNGLFSIVFRDNVSLEKVEEFLNNLTLIRQSEGWGSHITLAMRLNRNDRIYTTWPSGVVVRFHAGLENVRDLLRDLNRAGTMTFGPRARLPGIRNMDRESPPLSLVA